jgi:hypothetical protein
MRDAALVLHHVFVGGFFGSVVATLVLKIFAERQSGGITKHTIGSLVALDRLVTAPSAIGVTVTGVALIAIAGVQLLWMLWLQLLIVLWIIAAVAAHFVLVPKLKALECIADTGAPSLYQSKARQWNLMAAGLLLIPLVSYGLAVIKPS